MEDSRFQFTEWEAEALRVAIEACDALWDLDVARGHVSGGRTSGEYERLCPSPRLRQMLDESTEAGGE